MQHQVSPRFLHTVGWLLPALLFLTFAALTVPTLGPTQEEIFNHGYRDNVVCMTQDGQGRVTDVYCRAKDDRPNVERTRRVGPLVFWANATRPELEIQIGKRFVPVLEQTYQGASYAAFVWLGRAIFGDNLLGLRAALVAMGVLSLWLTFVVLRRHFDLAAAFLCTLLTGVMDLTIYTHSVTVYLQVQYVLVLLGLLHLLFVGPKDSRLSPPARAALLGLLSGLCVYLFVLLAAVVLALFVAAAVFFRDRLRLVFRVWWAAQPAFVLPLMPMIAYHVLFPRFGFVLVDQWREMLGEPDRLLPGLLERWLQLGQAIGGFANAFLTIGFAAGAPRTWSGGLPLALYACLAILLAGIGEPDATRRRLQRFLALTVCCLPITLSFTTWSSVHQAMVIMQPLAPIVLGLGILNAARALAGLARQPAAREKIFRVVGPVLAAGVLAAELHLSLHLVRTYPFFRGITVPVAAQRRLSRYLEAHEIQNAVNVATEDLLYPMEFLTRGRVRLKHYISVAGLRGWADDSAGQEWDRILRLNRGGYFLLMRFSFGDIPSDEEQFLAACRRNNLSPRIVARFFNAFEPIYNLYRLDDAPSPPAEKNSPPAKGTG
jgi:hypothetical protein